MSSYLSETHRLTLVSDSDYLGALDRSGLTVDVVPRPHADRDRYV
ncbi:MAG TPA: hypothetical protein VFI46_15440 [Jiangellaceae bacterium]|nr:hypothetical protein [Jiangellaceae bacterium]